MFHNPGYFRMIFADKASALKIRMEIFKKYAIRIGFFRIFVRLICRIVHQSGINIRKYLKLYNYETYHFKF